MRISSKILFVLFIINLYLMFPSFSQAENTHKPLSAPDTIPNSIIVKLDNVPLCNQRNEYRDPGDQLTCDGQSFDTTIYTMDEYTVGVLKAEVGGDVDTPNWHIEALKAMAVAVRSFTWTHGTVQTNGTFEMGSSPSTQTFFPEKPTGQQYQDAVTLTNGQFLSHPEGEELHKLLPGIILETTARTLEHT